MASYVSPTLRPKFETLSIDLKNRILERNVKLYTIYDLIHVLEEIVAEGPIPQTMEYTYLIQQQARIPNATLPIAI